MKMASIGSSDIGSAFHNLDGINKDNVESQSVGSLISKTAQYDVKPESLEVKKNFVIGSALPALCSVSSRIEIIRHFKMFPPESLQAAVDYVTIKYKSDYTLERMQEFLKLSHIRSND